MKGWLKWLAAAALLSAVIHVATVLAMPSAMILLAQHKSGAVPNQIHHGGPVTAASREVVRPSPDLLYSACPFDVSLRPLRITAAVPDGYFSVSGFGDNTDNFFVINDRKMEGKRFSMILVAPDDLKIASVTEPVVTAPSTRGVVLLRLLVKERSRIEALQKIQRQARCQPIDL
jgi:uncharacterized membrane protein